MALSAAAQAQATSPESSDSGIQEIIVTAQKRNESVNRIPMTITALTGDALLQKGIANPADLTKVVPGFIYTESPRGTPIFAIRGIGFDDNTLGSASTVALYTDEVPLSYSVQGRFAALDVERIEVLKGPQGILFGQNSTAGAINFIAAKPTGEFTAGFDGSFGRFNTVDARAFASGPITDELRVRVAIMGVRGDGWQKSITRDDTLGAKRQIAGRVITEWTPTDALTVKLMVNAWMDESDTQAAQLIAAYPLIPDAAVRDYSFYPIPPRKNRAADWDTSARSLSTGLRPHGPLRRDDNFFQPSLRIDYQVTDDVKITSITSYSRYNQDFTQDVDGSDLNNFAMNSVGDIRSFNQELRIAGEFNRLKWIVGGNYQRDRVFNSTWYWNPESSVRDGFLDLQTSRSHDHQKIRDIAGFGNLDYLLTDTLTLSAGIRYTKDKRSYSGCTADAGDGNQAHAYNIVLGLVGTPNEIQPGGCTTSSMGIPGLANFELSEDNVSWRAALSWQATPTTMLYANVTKGYKSGGFPAVNTADAIQLRGVTQESVLAFEAGVKAGLFNRRAQINIAGFYSDYRDKQLRGRILDPFGVFGVLDALLNIPKSRVYGAEAQLQLLPVDALNINFAGTYVNTRVTRDFFAYDPVGNLINYRGLGFPHTPKWNLSASADYTVPISNALKGFVGIDASYHSATSSLFNRPDLTGMAPLDPKFKPGVNVDPDVFRIKEYSIVDLRLGIEQGDGAWRAWIWGKNIFDTYYRLNSTQSIDSLYALTGMPATYGVSVSFRF